MPNFNLPSEWRQDWPARTGPVDLAIHDLPHDSSGCEWWYFNSHLTATEDSSFDATKNSMKYAHAVIWAISDETSREYHGYSLLDAESTDIVLAKIDKETDLDRNLRKSLKEVLQKGNLPRPDMTIYGNMVVSRDKLFLDFGGNLFWKDTEGKYHAELVGKHAFQEKGCRCDLVLTPKKAPVRNRSDGVVETGFHGEEMFYYFITRNSCEGSVSIGDDAFSVTGTAWYDHEFGGTTRYGEAKQEGSNEGLHSDNKSWEWRSVQLDNDMDLTICEETLYEIHVDLAEV